MVQAVVCKVKMLPADMQTKSALVPVVTPGRVICCAELTVSPTVVPPVCTENPPEAFGDWIRTPPVPLAPAVQYVVLAARPPAVVKPDDVLPISAVPGVAELMRLRRDFANVPVFVLLTV